LLNACFSEENYQQKRAGDNLFIHIIEPNRKQVYLKLFSSSLFIIPAAVSLFEKIYLYSCVILLCMISSFMYHLNNEQRYVWLDMVMSLSLMAVNIYFLIASGFMLPYAVIAGTIAAATFYFWSKGHRTDYDANHSFWHLSSVIITLCCLFGYRSFLHHYH